MAALTDSVTVRMRAPAGAVWALVTDVSRIGEFSPETLAGRWIGGATGPAVGAKFQGHVKRNGRGPMYWTTCRVVECEPGRVFAFVVELPGLSGVNTWRYVLQPDGEDTVVTESFQLVDRALARAYWAVFGRLRNRTNVHGMQQTLDRIKAVVEGN